MSNNQDEFLEQVIKYIKIDDIIKERQKKDKEEINVLKDKKKTFEKNILTHLNDTENLVINIANKGKLVKNVSTTKGAINKDLIKIGITDGLYETSLVKNDVLCDKVVETIMNIIDKKRPVKQKEYLKRINPRLAKAK
jgi:hypothetical protein